MGEMCPRCGMNEPIFGDRCIICNGLPDHTAIVIKALRDRVAKLDADLAKDHQDRQDHRKLESMEKDRIVRLESALKAWLKFNDETNWLPNPGTSGERRALVELSNGALRTD